MKPSNGEHYSMDKIAYLEAFDFERFRRWTPDDIEAILRNSVFESHNAVLNSPEAPLTEMDLSILLERFYQHFHIPDHLQSRFLDYGREYFWAIRILQNIFRTRDLTRKILEKTIINERMPDRTTWQFIANHAVLQIPIDLRSSLKERFLLYYEEMENLIRTFQSPEALRHYLFQRMDFLFHISPANQMDFRAFSNLVQNDLSHFNPLLFKHRVKIFPLPANDTESSLISPEKIMLTFWKNLILDWSHFTENRA